MTLGCAQPNEVHKQNNANRKAAFPLICRVMIAPFLAMLFAMFVTSFYLSEASWAGFSQGHVSKSRVNL